ncbi:MAG TPA: ABC transporter ATP-binding protein [Dongiaceae bacterium]|nr:ABC transporter ATP-binding protein [Dongiaceae bacterium]
MGALLEISGLSVEARQGGGWVEIVHGASVAIHPGEVVAFIGESGAGKTTLALSALGFNRSGTRFSGGSVHFDGIDVLALDRKARRDLRGRSVAYVAQSAAAALNPSITIGDQISESLRIHRIATAQGARERARALLALLDLPDPDRLAGRYPQQTSGGQQQRIMTAIAMSCGPKLLVLDEPTTALDVTTQIEVLKAIKDAIADQKAAAIYISHDLAVVAQIASRIIVLRRGSLVEQGPADEIIRAPRHEYTRALLSAVKVIPEIGRIGAGRGGAEPKRPVLSVQNVAAGYLKPALGRPLPRQSMVVQDISLHMAPGETLALVGESGSGKSTLARVIAGLLPAAEGDVVLDGKVLGRRVGDRTKEQLRRVQIVFQSPEQALNPRQRIGTAIGRALHFYFGTRAAERAGRIAELLNLVGLPAAFAEKFPDELSGGERQRVAIARALAAKPDIILCDEFLSALDTVVAAKVLQLMADLRDSQGVGYVFISHDLATVATIADRVAVMYAGRIVEIGRTADIFRAPNHPYTSLLIRSVPELRTDWLEETIGDRPVKAPDARAAKIAPGPGCPFRGRCALALPGVCEQTPPAIDLGDGHRLYCHRSVETLSAPQD